MSTAAGSGTPRSSASPARCLRPPASRPPRGWPSRSRPASSSRGLRARRDVPHSA
jgi:hypothetical protein